MSFTADGDLEYRIETDLATLLAAYQRIIDNFGSATVDVRASKDASTDRVRPAGAVEVTCEQTIRNTNEYVAHIRHIWETDPYKTDKNGRQVKTFIGATRDYYHQDSIIATINAAADDWRINSDGSLEETSSEDDSVLEGGNTVRRMILSVDMHVFVGS